MVDTSLNLLRNAKKDFRSESWNRFIRIYTPLIAQWLRRFGLTDADIPDMTQEVLLAAAKDLSKFQHNGRIGAFRNWLKLIALHRCRRHWQKQARQVSTAQLTEMHQRLDELADPNSELADTWNREHDEYVLRGLFELLEREFDADSLRAFYQVTILGFRPQDVADRCEMTIGRVYKAKYRIMRRLREAGRLFLE